MGFSWVRLLAVVLTAVAGFFGLALDFTFIEDGVTWGEILQTLSVVLAFVASYAVSQGEVRLARASSEGSAGSSSWVAELVQTVGVGPARLIVFAGPVLVSAGVFALVTWVLVRVGVGALVSALVGLAVGGVCLLLVWRRLRA